MTTQLDISALLQKIEFKAGTSNSNILSDRELNEARIFRSEIERELSYWDQEIARLVAKRDLVAQRLSRVQIAFAPHKRLPPEILADIFVHAATRSPVSFPADPSQVCWVLRKVCSRWRTVAVNEPRLWDNILITEYDVGSTDPLLPVALMTASVLPPTGLLSVSLRLRSEAAATAYINNVVIPNIHRVKELNLHRASTRFTHLFETGPDSLRSLETLTLDLSNISADDEFLQQFTASVGIFRNAINLKALDLKSSNWFKLAPVMLNVPLPWNQLTHLHITQQPLTFADAHRVLRECYALRVLHIEFYHLGGYRVDPSAPAKSLHFPDLEILELDGVLPDPDSLSCFRLLWKQLIILQLPIFGAANTNPQIFQIVRQCVQIRSLSFNLQSISPQATETLVLPQLKQLRMYIRESGLTEDTRFLDQLTMPALTVLHVTNDSGLSFPARTISAMITRSGCSLSEFSYNAEIVHVDNYPALHHLLALIPSIKEFKVEDLILDPASIHCIRNGELLPQVAILTCRVQESTVSHFVDLLGDRARGRNSAHATLHHTIANIRMGADRRLIDATNRRMQHLNTQFGTRFSIHLTQI